MRWWNFKRYRTADGRDLVQEWYDGADEQVQAEFGVLLDLMELEEDWFTPKHARRFLNRHIGLCEIILEVRRYDLDGRGKKKLRKLQCRPVGFATRDPRRLGDTLIEPGEFVLLGACTKSGGNYEHVKVFDQALRLKAELEQGRGTLHDHIL